MSNKSTKGARFINIITTTLNHAFDIHCFSGNFRQFHENFVKITSKSAGGKGINVSRALAKINDIVADKLAKNAVVVFAGSIAEESRYFLVREHSQNIA